MSNARHQTQGALLAEQLKQRPHTYLDMLDYALSTCPHKRLTEWLERSDNADKWQLQKGKKYLGQGRYSVTWAIVKKPRAPKPRSTVSADRSVTV